MAKFKVNEAAEEDLQRLYQYGLQNFGLVQTDQYLDSIFARFQQIAEEPLLYNAVDDIRDGYRRSISGMHSIYYRIHDNGVEIMRVLGREDTRREFK